MGGYAGKGLANDADDAGLLWEGLGNMWEEGWPMMLMMLPLFGHVWAWACVGGVWVVTREKGWPMMLTMLVYGGKDLGTCGKRAGR